MAAEPQLALDRFGEIPRLDAWDKVTGAAQYVEDLPDLPGTHFAAPLKSPYSHARILSVDSSKASRLPGVVGVLDATTLGTFGLTPDDPKKMDPDLIVLDKVRYQGDLLAVVVARDLRTARKAVDLIEVEFEPLRPVFSAAEALAAGAPLLHEHLGTNSVFDDSFEWGEVEKGFAEADYIYEDVISSPTLFHHPMEPIGTGLVRFNGEIAELWAPTNTPMRDAAGVARVFGLSPSQVHVKVPVVGGGFGAKKVTRDMMCALAVARKLGRPVKLVATAEQSFHVAVRHAMDFRSRIGVKADGRIVALDVELLVDAGAYFSGGRTATHNACISCWGAYRMPHFRVVAHTALTNKTPATPHRGTGKTQTVFSVECVIDRVAQRLGMDPIELRARNVLLPGERVAERWKVRGQEVPAYPAPLDVDFRLLMDQAAGSIAPAAPTAASSDGSRVRGRGIAISLRHGSKGDEESQALAVMSGEGIVTVAHNAADLGQGIYNMIRVVAARTLGLPESHVKVEQPDTGNMLRFAGASAQRTTVEMGNAVAAACRQLKQQVIDLATEAHGGNPEDWSLADGTLWRNEQSYSLPDLLGGSSNVVLKAEGSDTEVYVSDLAFGSFEHWAPGAAAAEVEVDIETGEVQVLQYSILADAGKVIHYNAAHGQLEGGAVMGFGIALFEELRYEDGQVQNADAFQYRLPLMSDVPPAFQVVITENEDGPGPFGAKGLAQTSIPCVAPAVANAILNATGGAVDGTPFTPSRVLRALGKLGDAD